MSTSTTNPFEANASQAVQMFFSSRVTVIDTDSRKHNPEMHKRVADLAASFVSDRLSTFRGDGSEHREEIEFTFKSEGGKGSYELAKPVSLATDLKSRFHGARIQVRDDVPAHQVATSAPDTWSLRVSSDFVTFGGQIFWQSRESRDSHTGNHGVS